MFCNHDFVPRTGMDSGSICSKCYKISSNEVDFSKSGGLNDGKLFKENSGFMKIMLSALTPKKNKSNNVKIM